MAKLICVFKRPKESQKSIALGVDCGSLGNMLKLSNSRIRWLATKVGRRNVVAAVLVAITPLDRQLCGDGRKCQRQHR